MARYQKFIFIERCYLAIALLVIFALLAEVLLRVDYLQRRKIAGSYHRINLYSAQRTIVEAAENSLWDVKWQSYKPGASLSFEDAGERFSIEINEYGFRTPSFSKVKPEGVYRIIAIGGSTTVQGKDNSSTYPALMQKMFVAEYPRRRVEVLNFGISGTQSDYWINRLDELLSFQPDLVIQYNAINDLAWKYQKHYVAEYPLQAILHQSYLVQISGLLSYEGMYPYYQQIAENLMTMQQKLGAHGVDYLSASFAMPNYNQASDSFQAFLDVDSRIWGRALDMRYYKNLKKMMGLYNQHVSIYAEQHNLEFHPFDAFLDDPIVFVDSCHLDDKGIQMMALYFFNAARVLLDQ